MDQKVKVAADSLLAAAGSVMLPAAVREGLRQSASALVALDARVAETEAMHAKLVALRDAARAMMARPELLGEWESMAVRMGVIDGVRSRRPGISDQDALAVAEQVLGLAWTGPNGAAGHFVLDARES